MTNANALTSNARVANATFGDRALARARESAREVAPPVVAWASVFVLAYGVLRMRESGANAFMNAFTRSRSRNKSERGEGKWVTDRSLGGRAVWVPKPTSDAGASRDARKRLEGALDVRSTANGEQKTTSNAKSSAPLGAIGVKAAMATPTWWREPAPVYVPPGRRDDLLRVAKVEGGKLAQKRVSGVGFTPDVIADFRNACAAAASAGACAAAVGPESARVAVFRAAAEFAVDDALRGQAGALSSFNTPVGPFLVGLCEDLALTPQKCVGVVTASTAVRLRGALVQAGAAIRSKDTVEVMLELNKVVNLFNVFPLAPGAPELDMLSASLRTRLSDAERRGLLDEFANVSGGAFADVVQEAIFGGGERAS